MKHLFLIAAIVIFFAGAAYSQRSDAMLKKISEEDAASRDGSGALRLLSAAEHTLRASVYSSNRHFPEAREHWMKLIENYPNDGAIPAALFGIARSYMWEQKYQMAIDWFQKLTKDHLDTKDGREGQAFLGASYVRMGKNLEAAKTYEQYTVMFPEGERIESAYLNIIDAYREAGEYELARQWVKKTAVKFAGKPSAVNALHARVRMEIFRQDWQAAVNAANELLEARPFAGSMVSTDEAGYLKAFALEKQGKMAEAAAIYNSISGSSISYFGALAAENLPQDSVKRTVSAASRAYSDYPSPFATEILKNARRHNIDPRFILAVMRQESSFRANAKSTAAARGLLQLVYDTALKYKEAAGINSLQPDDLYSPPVNIAIGTLYMAALKEKFNGVYEAIAASYNAGEDNAERWLNRSRPQEAGIFTSEIGFSETKNYVFKVMYNYRVYRELYDENLNRR